MLKFNNNHIFTGYLKQLLASFNLPKYKVYTKEQQEYFNKYGTNKDFRELNVIPTIKMKNNKSPEDLRYVPYIKDNKIQHYIKELNDDGSVRRYYWQVSNKHYHENKKELNYTKTFQVKNNIYDYYTHEYLGNFLRFFRDYYGLNLMSLYNCFSDKLCSNLNLSFDLGDKTITFSSRDENFKVYMLPVKLHQKYTIAIDSNAPVELCCGVYGAYLDTRHAAKVLSKITYQKIGSTNFNQPFIYNKLATNTLTMEDIDILNLAQDEADLRLFIKVPINNKSSIVVLEGDYLGYNDSLYEPSTEILHQNRMATNFFEGRSEDPNYTYEYLDDRKFKPISKLQLLMMNTGTSYPFADRLIEYLSENAVTKLDKLPDNIKRAQVVLTAAKYSDNTKKYVPDTYGLWDNKLTIYIYDAVMNNSRHTYQSEAKHDIIGYLDKDTENLVAKKNRKTNTYESISKIDIYSTMYNNMYLTDREKFKDTEEAENE